MQASFLTAATVQELKTQIHQVLCQYEKLEVGVFPMTETVLKRRRKPCGMYFCLHGPRSVKFTAIWEADSNTVLFYGASGERFLKVQLAGKPELEALQA